jgi:hypothetical protein
MAPLTDFEMIVIQSLHNYQNMPEPLFGLHLPWLVTAPDGKSVTLQYTFMYMDPLGLFSEQKPVRTLAISNPVNLSDEETINLLNLCYIMSNSVATTASVPASAISLLLRQQQIANAGTAAAATPPQTLWKRITQSTIARMYPTDAGDATPSADAHAKTTSSSTTPTPTPGYALF